MNTPFVYLDYNASTPNDAIIGTVMARKKQGKAMFKTFSPEGIVV